MGHKNLVREYHGRVCPQCGSTLFTNGRRVWCSFVGTGPEPPCGFGIDHAVGYRPEPEGVAELSGALRTGLARLAIETTKAA
jgi:hypothetical protein